MYDLHDFDNLKFSLKMLILNYLSFLYNIDCF